jgi:VanZ family protein
MTVIFSASTHLGSPEHTSRFIRPFLLWLNPHMPEVTIEKIHYAVRKCAHFCEYAILGILTLRTARLDPTFSAASAGRKYRLAILFCMLYASSDEFHQSFVPTRQPAVMDVMIDTCGAGFGLLAIWVIYRLRKTPDAPSLK